MAAGVWNDEAIPMLRVLINDTDTCNPTYSDERLETTLVVAGQLITTELKDFLLYEYDISVEEVTITPDPVTSSPDDDAFLNLMVLKAACIIDQWSLRSSTSKQNVKAQLGPASLAVGDQSPGFKTLMEHGPCKALEELIEEIIFTQNTGVARAILSPFTHNKFILNNIGYQNYRN